MGALSFGWNFQQWVGNRAQHFVQALHRECSQEVLGLPACSTSTVSISLRCALGWEECFYNAVAFSLFCLLSGCFSISRLVRRATESPLRDRYVFLGLCLTHIWDVPRARAFTIAMVVEQRVGCFGSKRHVPGVTNQVGLLEWPHGGLS